jgi:two-component system, OmpR family, alkaline phosphatase synthesis response regulator PhoP
MPNEASARTALVVEDDADIGKLLQWVLQREGFAVTLVADGRLARERIAAGPAAQLVLLDVMLPHVSGHELLAELRAQPAWKAVPVIMLTAKSQEKDIVKALDAGANDYMLKPFQPTELRARIRRLVPA